MPQAATGSAGVAWREPIEVGRGPAYRGPWRMNDSEFHYVDDPTVAVDDTGRIAVVWANQMRQDIFFKAYDAAGVAMVPEPVNVSRSPDVFSWLPRVAIPMGDPRRVYILWQEIIFSGGSHGGEIFFARSIDGGQSFESPVNLSGTIAGDGKGRLSSGSWDNGSLDLAVDPGGGIHAAWTEYEGALWYRRSADGGQTFAEAVHIAGDGTAPARGPSLAVDGDRAVHLAWTVGQDPAADVRLTSSADAGVTFDAPTVVHESDGHADAPRLRVDREGTLHLAYAEAPRRERGRYHIHYTRRLPGHETFEVPRRVAGTDANGVESAGFPSLDVDADGNVYVVWERLGTSRGRSVGLEFAHSNDGGRTFGSSTVVPGTADPDLGFNGGLQGLLMRKLAVAGDGTIAVVNSSFREGEVSRVRLILGRVDNRTSPRP